MLSDETGVADRGPKQRLAFSAKSQHLCVCLPQTKFSPRPFVNLLPVLLKTSKIKKMFFFLCLRDRFTAPFFHIFSVLKMRENVGSDAKKRRIPTFSHIFKKEKMWKNGAVKRAVP